MTAVGALVSLCCFSFNNSRGEGGSKIVKNSCTGIDEASVYDSEVTREWGRETSVVTVYV
jgi:hypothetical protein